VVENAVVKTPVVELYASGYTAESEVEEILLVKRVKSEDARYPFAPVVACVILIALPVRVRGALKVRALSRPSDEVAVRVYPPVAFPTRSCPYVGSVEIPVPPYTTESVLVAETTPLTAWRFPVMEPMVRPPLKVLEPLYVFAVVVPNAVVKTPVVELYASGYTAESEVEEILLLKSVQSADESAPACEPLAVLIARVFPENVSGDETVVAETTPDALVERSALGTPVRPRVVVVALVVRVFVNVCVPPQVFEVVVPNARLITEPLTCTG
jgi:hypothetical protein